MTVKPSGCRTLLADAGHFGRNFEGYSWALLLAWYLCFLVGYEEFSHCKPLPPRTRPFYHAFFIMMDHEPKSASLLLVMSLKYFLTRQWEKYLIHPIKFQPPSKEALMPKTGYWDSPKSIYDCSTGSDLQSRVGRQSSENCLSVHWVSGQLGLQSMTLPQKPKANNSTRATMNILSSMWNRLTLPSQCQTVAFQLHWSAIAPKRFTLFPSTSLFPTVGRPASLPSSTH